jgi:periplasmic protein TonB
MFRETLLESAPGTRRRKRWPMVLAVALEVTVCSVLVALPLFSTGIIPVAARTPVVFPKLDHVRIADHPSNNSTESSGRIIPVSRTPGVVTFGDSRPTIEKGTDPSTDKDSAEPDIGAVGRGNVLSDCTICLSTTKPPGRDRPVTLSRGVIEGYLIHRVDPVYPHIALISGVEGEVRLHAIISKDGVMESLTLISGHPLLAKPAIEAVRQWRYRPYLLNHEPVEVETLITVNFTRGH